MMDAWVYVNSGIFAIYVRWCIVLAAALSCYRRVWFLRCVKTPRCYVSVSSLLKFRKDLPPSFLWHNLSETIAHANVKNYSIAENGIGGNLMLINKLEPNSVYIQPDLPSRHIKSTPKLKFAWCLILKPERSWNDSSSTTVEQFHKRISTN